MWERSRLSTSNHHGEGFQSTTPLHAIRLNGATGKQFAVSNVSKGRRAAQLPERPSKRLQQFHIQGAIYGPPHQGPISRPHPHREPVLIGAPLELLADPTRWTSHRCRHRSNISVFGALLCVRASYARCSSFPQVRREAVKLSLSGPKLVGIHVIGPALSKDPGGYPPVSRSSMLLATSSQTDAKSRNSCLPKTFSVFSASCRYIAASSRR